MPKPDDRDFATLLRMLRQLYAAAECIRHAQDLTERTAAWVVYNDLRGRVKRLLERLEGAT